MPCGGGFVENMVCFPFVVADAVITMHICLLICLHSGMRGHRPRYHPEAFDWAS